MNLQARTKSGEIELWQTPSRISYTILPRSEGTVKGKKAKEALLRYMEWVTFSLDGIWSKTFEEFQEAKIAVEKHLEYIRTFLNEKTLEVWVM